MPKNDVAAFIWGGLLFVFLVVYCQHRYQQRCTRRQREQAHRERLQRVAADRDELSRQWHDPLH